jgi:nucleotide-binding universal stress UspA family protein
VLTGRFELGTDGPAVLVAGVDGSPASLRAGAYAAGMARRQKARLVVVCVSAYSGFTGLAPGAAALMEEALAEASALVEAAVAEGAAYVGIAVEFISVRGEPASELSRIARQLHADGVVIGASHHLRLHGSLAHRLIKEGQWPITVVP